MSELSDQISTDVALQVATAWRDAEREKLRGEVERLREALRELDRCCSFGAQNHGMTEWGVQDLRRQIARALDEEDKDA